MIISFLFSVTFSYSQSEINNLIWNKLDTYLGKVENKYSSLSTFEVCIKKKDYLQNLHDKVAEIYTKFRSKKDIYKVLITIKKLSIEKKDEINCQNNIWWGDFWLENKINIDSYKYYNYNYSGAKKISYTITEYAEASNIEWNFYKIWWHWFLFEQYNFYSNISSSQKSLYTNTAKKENPGSMVFYYKDNWKYKIIIVRKENIKYVWDYNINYNSLPIITKYNKEKTKTYWVNIIGGILYSKGDTIYKSAIFEEEGKLYYLINHGEVSYTTIPNDIDEKSQYLMAVYHAQWGKYVYRKWGKYYVLSWDLKVYPIWYKSYYKNIDLWRLEELLENSFFWASKSGYNYKLQDMYDIIKYSKEFNKKKLSQLYEDMKNNMKYNLTIKDLLNKDGWWDDQIQNYVNTHKDIMKVFNIFETMNNKEWVCETFSEIFSIVALFNGLDADVLVWKAIKWNYGHQISDIEWYYYDLTFDLWYQKTKYFAMDRDLLDEYFIGNR